MQYESPITSGKKVMAKVKVFVHALHADADGRAMTSSPDIRPGLPKGLVYIMFTRYFSNCSL